MRTWIVMSAVGLMGIATVACGDDGTGGSGAAGGSEGGTGGVGTVGGATSTGGTGGGATAQTCDAYCTSIAANCVGANQQYPGDASNKASCLEACKSFPQGTAADTMGNTLGCRVYHTDAAKGVPATHCEHAGPLGGGQCGDSSGATDTELECASFCAIATDVCGTIWPADDDCRTQCLTVANATAYNINVTTGANLACRMYHLSVAASFPAPDAGRATHCGHTRITTPAPAADDPCK